MISSVKIIAVGKVKASYIKNAISEYKKRMIPFCKFEIIELKDEGMKKEAEKIKEMLDPQTYVLDEKGKQLCSLEFAKLFKEMDGTVTFVIGGPDWIDPSLKKNIISLSKMTFLHEMCRLFLIEQIYRTYMINSNREYHR